MAHAQHAVARHRPRGVDNAKFDRRRISEEAEDAVLSVFSVSGCRSPNADGQTVREISFGRHQLQSAAAGPCGVHDPPLVCFRG